MARSGVIYGPTGTRKTSQIKWFAHYIAQTTGKSTLLLSTDGGGWEPCQPEIDAGMIRAYRVETATIPLSILQMLSKGYWPQDVSETRADKINMLPVNWDEVGAVAVEGWTSISQVIMRYLPDRNINVGGEDRSKLGGFSQEMFVEGQRTRSDFRSNTRGDYGFVQNQLYGLVMNFNSLPCRYVLHTALESKTEDDDRATTFGPAISGKKASAQCGAWVGDMIHAQDYITPRTIKVDDPSKPGQKMDSIVRDMTVRFHFKTHLDQLTGVPFPCKTRVTPEKISALDARFPGGYFEPSTSEGFDTYLKVVDELSAGQADSLKNWREKMDGKVRGTAVAVK